MVKIVEAEIKARAIKVTDEKLKSLSLAEKRKLLKRDELQRRIDEELKEKDIQYIVPISKEMIAVMTDGTQQSILDKEAGHVAAEQR